MMLPQLPAHEKWWITQVDLKPLEDRDQEIVPPDASGAIAWLAVRGEDMDAAIDNLRATLFAVGLEATTIEEIHPIFDIEDAEGYSPQVAVNFRELESVGQSVWGDIFAYFGEGEA